MRIGRIILVIIVTAIVAFLVFFSLIERVKNTDIVIVPETIDTEGRIPLFLGKIHPGMRKSVVMDYLENIGNPEYVSVKDKDGVKKEQKTGKYAAIARKRKIEAIFWLVDDYNNFYQLVFYKKRLANFKFYADQETVERLINHSSVDDHINISDTYVILAVSGFTYSIHIMKDTSPQKQFNFDIGKAGEDKTYWVCYELNRINETVEDLLEDIQVKYEFLEGNTNG